MANSAKSRCWGQCASLTNGHLHVGSVELNVQDRRMLNLGLVLIERPPTRPLSISPCTDYR